MSVEIILSLEGAAEEDVRGNSRDRISSYNEMFQNVNSSKLYSNSTEEMSSVWSL